MKTYSGKTVEEALQIAASEAGVEVDDLIYIVPIRKKVFLPKRSLLKYMN